MASANSNKGAIVIRRVIRSAIGSGHQPLGAPISSLNLRVDVPLAVFDRVGVGVEISQRLLAVPAEIQKGAAPFVALGSAPVFLNIVQDFEHLARDRLPRTRRGRPFARTTLNRRPRGRGTLG